ncbi:MAG TPA: hypothetical protein VL443_20405 [Cyclobacteriaceae bacterium]|nr:hypothetical protein [Cyclobacteriaceae bacterium]
MKHNLMRMISGKFMLAVALVVAVSACKKDDEKPSNNVTIDGTVKGLKSALFIYDATSSESPVDSKPYYRNELVLFSSGLTNSGDELTGKGDFLDLEINGGSQTLEEGTYTFTGTEENSQAFQIWEASAAIGYDISTQKGETYDFTSGAMVVTKSGDKYTIKVNAVAGSHVIVGTFTGSITSVEEN